MYKEISLYDFIEAFASNESYKNNFSRKGLEAIYEYLEDIHNESYKLNVCDIACTFGECTIEEALKDNACESIKELQDATWCKVIDNDQVVYQIY
jgi:hypothetical protein